MKAALVVFVVAAATGGCAVFGSGFRAATMPVIRGGDTMIRGWVVSRSASRLCGLLMFIFDCPDTDDVDRLVRELTDINRATALVDVRVNQQTTVLPLFAICTTRVTGITAMASKVTISQQPATPAAPVGPTAAPVDGRCDANHPVKIARVGEANCYMTIDHRAYGTTAAVSCLRTIAAASSMGASSCP